MNNNELNFKRERANDGMDVKDCIFGCIVAFGILVAYIVVAFLE